MSSHGPVKARRSVGELHGPPDVPRQVRLITVQVEQLDDGRWRFRQPKAAGWVAVARTPVEVAVALRGAFTEAQVAAYSGWRGHVYDQPDAILHRRHKPRARSRKRCDVYSAEEWKLDTDGMWIAPGSGHRFPEDRQVVQRVMAARKAAGLSPRPDPVQPEPVQAEQLQESA